MSINEMILISRICFGGMILFLLLSVLLFFQLNIRKAWEIVSGKYLSGHSGQTVKVPSTKLSTRDMINSGQLQERYKTDLSSADLRKLLQEEHATKILQEEHATKILQEDYATKILQEDHETLILQQEQSTTVTQASDETTVLRYGETVLLAEELAGRNKFDIIVDITYVHTQIVI